MQDNIKYFDYRFKVTFEETNLVGNVYFANYFVWQGKCREYFLAKHAPRVLDDFAAGHGMITKDSRCDFIHEAFAFDDILIRLSLGRLSRTVVTMNFDYYKTVNKENILLARGQQSAIWANPDHSIGMLPTYLYDAVSMFSNVDEAVSVW